MLDHQDKASMNPDLGRTAVHQLAYQVEGDANERAQKLRALIIADLTVLAKLDRDGRTPLDAARSTHDQDAPGSAINNKPILDIFKEYGAPTAASVSMTARLMSEATANEVVAAWRKEIAENSRFGTEASAWAVQSNRQDVLHEVAKINRADIIQKDLNRWLKEACSQSRSIVADALLTLGANPNQPGQREGSTLLHDASRKGHQGMVFALASHGAAVNSQDPSGSTPLILAVQSRNPAAVMALLRAGADPTIENKDKKNALAIAEQVRLIPSFLSLSARVQADQTRVISISSKDRFCSIELAQ
jgi:hypothetical protein